MSNRLDELKNECYFEEVCGDNAQNSYTIVRFDTEKYARLVVQECIDNLIFHGHDDAASQLEWLRGNRL